MGNIVTLFLQRFQQVGYLLFGLVVDGYVPVLVVIEAGERELDPLFDRLPPFLQLLFLFLLPVLSRISLLCPNQRTREKAGEKSRRQGYHAHKHHCAPHYISSSPISLPPSMLTSCPHTCNQPSRQLYRFVYFRLRTGDAAKLVSVTWITFTF